MVASGAIPNRRMPASSPHLCAEYQIPSPTATKIKVESQAQPQVGRRSRSTVESKPKILRSVIIHP